MTDQTPGAEAPAVAAEGQTEQTTQPNAEPTPAGQGNDQGAQATPKKVPWFQERINELTRARREAERERDAWREQASRTAQPPKPTTEPTLEQFDFDQAKYAKAMAEYVAEQKFSHWQQEQAQKEKQTTAQQRVRSFLEKDAAFKASTPDYKGAQELSEDASFPITQAMTEVIADSEMGSAMLHYLDTHREEAYEISKMGDFKAAAALGRIEAKLTRVDPETPVPTKTVTKAAPPTPTVKPTAPIKKEPKDMTVDEWMEHRNTELKQQR
jgi:hypothetical protein